MGSGNDPISLGVTYGEAKSVHLESLYDIRRRIAAVIENAGITHNKLDYNAIKMLVELAITLIPDIQQGEKCRTLMQQKYEDVLNEISAESGTEVRYLDADVKLQALGEAAILTLQLVQVIFDDDIGIRTQHTVGVI